VALIIGGKKKELKNIKFTDTRLLFKMREV